MRKFGFVFASLIVLAACSHSPGAPAIPANVAPAGKSSGPNSIARVGASNKIQHVVFIIQENRTYDNIFGGANPFAGGVAKGEISNGTSIDLTEVNLEKPVFSGGDPNNYHYQWLTACNATKPQPWPLGQPAPCQMNGFDKNATSQKGYPSPPGRSTIYSYANRDEVAPYWFIARKYAVGDRFFMGHNSESYTGHQYIFSSTSHGTVDAPVWPGSLYCTAIYDFCAYTPWGCDSPSGTLMYQINGATGAYNGPPPTPNPETAPRPCFGANGGYPSIADLAQAKNVSWRLYAYSMCSGIVGLDANYTIRYKLGVWPNPDKMKYCYNYYGLYTPLTANTAHFVAPQYQFLNDETGTNKKALAAITWLLPGAYTSDHPGVPNGDCGPTWVARVINTIGRSSDWNSTVIFVLWDDWGGFYDHVPPYVVRDQTGPGFRVPLLVISPYVRKGSVVDTNLEFASLNKFVEDTFNLGSLGATDKSPYLNNLDAFFDFNQAPQAFVSVPHPSYTRCNYLPKKTDATALQNSRWLRMNGGAEPDGD